MLKQFSFLLSTIFYLQFSFAQNTSALIWADSVYKTLSDDERIAQLMIVRLSTIDTKTKSIIFYDTLVTDLVKKYNIGGICLFQGSPVKQATLINALQAKAQTPLLICIDAEWGLGMRMTDSVFNLPKQMMLGAMQNANIVYEYGKIVAEQCKRMGIQVNYAPVVDINNNPNNPVINDRSFGEDKYKVASFATEYSKGLQDNGVMACAKHFPGHGDVSTDSHYDLPLINKSLAQLDSLELYPFKQIFKAGIGSVMVAHLSIPAIDNTPNWATSISNKNVTHLLKNQLGFAGLVFTDALEMQGVKKYFPDGAASVEALIAGNDMLCLPGDVPLSILKIKEALKNKKLSWADIETHCKKVLAAKYKYGLSKLTPINTANLTNDLNSKINGLTKIIAENALTVLKKTDSLFFPLAPSPSLTKTDIVYVSIGNSSDNAFAKRMRKDYNADVIYFNYSLPADSVSSILSQIKKSYKKVIIGIHNFSRYPKNNFGISQPAIDFVTQVQQQTTAITFVFGNAYAIKNWCGAKNIVACYEDGEIIQNTAVDLLQGKIRAQGKLPVSVCDSFKYGSGIVFTNATLPQTNADEVGFDPVKLQIIDSITNDAIEKGATPGAVVLVAKDGKIAYHKAFGHFTYDKKQWVNLESIFDIASVTKMCATTLCIMKLYDEGKIDLNQTLGFYLPWVKGSNKENLLIKNLLLHQAGLIPFIPFYKEVLDTNGKPLSKYFSNKITDTTKIIVAQNLFMKAGYLDTMYKRILQSPVSSSNKYVYSDNDFIFLGKIIESLTGKGLDEYVAQEFYTPLGLTSIGFNPTKKFVAHQIVPTEQEKDFRQQLLQGFVHDPGAAMFGGVAGHAGLFSNAYDMAVIMQMLLNGGNFKGKKYLSPSTIKLFTSYQSDSSRRGYGFDKPEKNNATSPEPYPCLSASSQTFGHTGFTGTCAWADPAHNLIFIFLSNRIHPDGGDNKKLLQLNVRPKIFETIYKAMGLK